MKTHRSVPLLLAIGVSALAGCLERLDTGAAKGTLSTSGAGGTDVTGAGGSGATGGGSALGSGGASTGGGGNGGTSPTPDSGGDPPDPPKTPTTAIGTPAIEFVTPQGEATTTTSPCEATTAHAMTILTVNCGVCHAGRNGGERQGQPPFDYVLNVEKLVAARSASVPDPLAPPANRIPGMPGFQGMRFLIPGDPDNSRLYFRIFHKEMPPPPIVGAADPVTSRPTVSDFSVIRHWIDECVETGDGDNGGDDAGGGDDEGEPDQGDAGADAGRGR
ncbi:MAG TPA: hypothetical protein VGL13_14140 [Polyangiaceae bacterium]|jgi:hypothetical protein